MSGSGSGVSIVPTTEAHLIGHRQPQAAGLTSCGTFHLSISRSHRKATVLGRGGGESKVPSHEDRFLIARHSTIGGRNR